MSLGREGISRCGDGNGPPLDAGNPASYKLVSASLVLESQDRVHGVFQHAVFSPRDYSAWLRSGRRFYYICNNLSEASRKSLAVGVVVGPDVLASRNAAFLRDRINDAWCDAEHHTWSVR